MKFKVIEINFPNGFRGFLFFSKRKAASFQMAALQYQQLDRVRIIEKLFFISLLHICRWRRRKYGSKIKSFETFRFKTFWLVDIFYFGTCRKVVQILFELHEV